MFGPVTVLAQVTTNAEEAFKVSSETKKPVLLVFAGSDWCAPCIRFERKVMSENSFIRFADENLIILKADFPQRQKLPAALQRQNEKLAEEYNPKGVFPFFLLLGIDRSVLSTLNYTNESSLEFISEIKSRLMK
jgi:thiol-disulfide isomerase/thioredoxin